VQEGIGKSAGEWHFTLTKANPEDWEDWDDWDIGFALNYKNLAALDGLAQQILDLRMKQSKWTCRS
jgi:hypothetical protein